MAKRWKLATVILALAVLIGLLNFKSLSQRIRRLSESQAVEEQARREVLTPPITTPTDVLVNAKIFWAGGADRVTPSEIPLPLSADPVQRSKQVLHALIASAPTPEARTLPADAELLGFYILPDGTAVADFSDALASEIPSGILSEETTLQSILQTLRNNVSSLRRLKILLHGQEVDTLAGHVDLTGFFDLTPPPQTDSVSDSPSSSVTASPGVTLPDTLNASHTGAHGADLGTPTAPKSPGAVKPGVKP